MWRYQAAGYHRLRRLPGAGFCLRREKQNLKMLMSRIENRDTPVLDIGSGVGSTLDILPREREIVAIDQSRAMIGRIRDAGVLKITARDNSLPLAKAKFSLITVIGVTEYIRDLNPMMREIHRVSRPGACLLITYASPSFFNLLRYLLGHRLFWRRRKSFLACMKQWDFRLEAETRSLIQRQLLFRRRGAL